MEESKDEDVVQKGSKQRKAQSTKGLHAQKRSNHNRAQCTKGLKSRKGSKHKRAQSTKELKKGSNDLEVICVPPRVE